MFHHDLMRSQVSHLVIEAFSAALGIAFNAVQRPNVGDNPHLPITPSVIMLVEGLRTASFLTGTERTFVTFRPGGLLVFLNHPALGDGVPS
jgi:hypothetical protein